FYMSHVSPEHTSMVNQLLQVAIREKNEFACEYDLFTKSGKLKTVSTMGKVISNGEGTVEKVLGITRDITTFKNFEKERERSFQELNRINKELEEFAYIASHDLQEPLRKITMFSERLRASCHDALNDNSKLYMDRIQSAAEAMRILIDNLLDYSRTSRGPQKFEKVELKKIFQEVISELELKIDESMTHIKVNELPEIEAVYAEMKQLFANLLNNAIKFRKPGSESKIEIESNALSDVERRSRDLPEGNYHKIQVRDWGIGFEQQYADKIFQIFQRLHGKKEYPGSGIGLAICKKVVDNHHGLIYAESEPEKGATFAVILPEKQ
ncbi:MAG: ATP-binding protein, partial [Bacteroidota bacterium]